jgi:hypothetical protein
VQRGHHGVGSSRRSLGRRRTFGFDSEDAQRAVGARAALLPAAGTTAATPPPLASTRSVQDVRGRLLALVAFTVFALLPPVLVVRRSASARRHWVRPGGLTRQRRARMRGNDEPSGASLLIARPGTVAAPPGARRLEMMGNVGPHQRKPPQPGATKTALWGVCAARVSPRTRADQSICTIMASWARTAGSADGLPGGLHSLGFGARVARVGPRPFASSNW